MGYIEDVAAAKARLDEAAKAYTASVKEAERLEKQARKDYDKSVKDAQKALNNCEQSWAKPLASFGGLRLYATRVATASKSLTLLGDVDARVENAGPKARDKHKLFITITTPDGQLMEEGDAAKEKEAREFAAKVINQSKAAPAALQSYDEVRQRLAQAVEDAKSNTAAVDAAAAATQAARDATEARDEAQRQYDEAKASGTEEEIAELKAKEQKARQKKLALYGAAGVLALLIMLFATHVICFHKWQDATCTVPETCSVCGRTRGEALGHEWKEATCTSPKTCDRCEETEGEALGHKVEKWETTKKATCTEKGQQEGTCARCGKKQTRETKMKDHSFGDWAVTKEASCTKEGVRTRVCQSCGKEETETIKKTDHTPGDWVVVQEPSVTSLGSVNAGVRTRSCTACGTELEREEFTIELTMGQKNAMAKAASYLSFQSFSYSGLVEQLEFEGFSHEDAVFAVDHCGADWNEQAALKAQSYLDFMSFSRQGLIDQLVFEGFSYEQAEYGVSAVGY